MDYQRQHCYVYGVNTNVSIHANAVTDTPFNTSLITEVNVFDVFESDPG
jgi:hypothetical protein